jgi:hypothetical protein
MLNTNIPFLFSLSNISTFNITPYILEFIFKILWMVKSYELY